MVIAGFMNLKNRYLQFFALLVLSVIWGSSFILMKRGLESFTGLQVGAMRVFFSFLVLIPFAVKHLKRINKRNFLPLLAVGFIGNFFPAFFYALAQTKVSSSLAGMLNSMVPIFALLVGLFFFRQIPRRLTLVGVFLGLPGAAGLILFQSGLKLSLENISFTFLIVAATLFYAISLNIIKHKLADFGGAAITAVVFMFVGPVAGIFLAFTDFSPALATPDFTENLIYVIMLAVLSSALAVSLFYALVQYADPIYAASVTYLIPIVAVIWGLADGEDINIRQAASAVLILSGIYLIRKGGTKKAASEGGS